MSTQPEAPPSDNLGASSESILPAGIQLVLILVGLIGSGKSTFAQALEQYFPEICRCSQDDLGNRRSVEELARRSLARGLSVCIDRTNFDESQRATWINIARESQAETWVIVFDTPYEICAARVAERKGTGHPTITTPELGLEVLQRFRHQYRPPASHEGYTRILYLKPADCPDSGYSEEDVRDVMRKLRESPEVVPVARPSMRDHDSHRGSFNQQRGYRGRGFQTQGSYSRGSRGGPYTHGGYRGGSTHQTTLPWTRRGGDSSGTSAGSGYAHASDSRRSGYRAEDGSRSADFDRTQESWRR
ncbi:P-loop containing nucleoside triphosphate hydrolase protein [Lenzites betulinus]|nr:P-loop containing nucleoside triphosphate hydrolase protein [Lenzites betulinus]